MPNGFERYLKQRNGWKHNNYRVEPKQRKTSVKHDKSKFGEGVRNG